MQQAATSQHKVPLLWLQDQQTADAEARQDDQEQQASPRATPPQPTCASHTSSDLAEMARCSICSNRRRRSNLIWACFALWAVPVALASTRVMGMWGPPHRPAVKTPIGRLLLVQVVFRHGARTPLSDAYFNSSSSGSSGAAAWTHCSEQPLQPGGPGGGGVRLSLYDPSGAGPPPPLSGGDAPVLPGGCRMGALTDRGFQDALALGAALRRRYVLAPGRALLPPDRLSAAHVGARSTAVRRTVATLRGVLSGLYPNASALVRVAVAPEEAETLTGDVGGCPALANLTARLGARQQQRDAHDAHLHEFEARVRSSLRLPASDEPLRWTRLYDEYACAAAEGQPPPAAAAQPHLMRRVDALTMERRMELLAPEEGHCLLGKRAEAQCKQATALTIGRLLQELLDNMADAAAAAANGTAAASGDGALAVAGSSEGAGRSGSSAAAAGGRRLWLQADGGQGQAGGSSSNSSAGRRPAAQPYGRMLLFSAHDTTLIPLLTALGQHQDSWPDFASSLAFELWQEEGGRLRVRVLHDGQPIPLPLPEGGGSGVDGGSSLHATMQGGSSSGSGVAGLLASLPQRLAARVDQLQLAAAAAWRQVSRRGEAAGAGALGGLNGQGAYERSAYVVSLDEFGRDVLGDYAVSPEDYATACGAPAGAPGSRQGSWHAQFA